MKLCVEPESSKATSHICSVGRPNPSDGVEGDSRLHIRCLGRRLCGHLARCGLHCRDGLSGVVLHEVGAL